MLSFSSLLSLPRLATHWSLTGTGLKRTQDANLHIEVESVIPNRTSQRGAKSNSEQQERKAQRLGLEKITDRHLETQRRSKLIAEVRDEPRLRGRKIVVCWPPPALKCNSPVQNNVEALE